jgi:tRNA modification GTPase
MPHDLDDVIVALASGAGGAARCVIRLSGLGVGECLRACAANVDARLSEFLAPRGIPRRSPYSLHCEADGRTLEIPGELLFWPTSRSYTRQPSAEFHMAGSPPLAAAAVEQFCRAGARAAAPGEFTLRAFLAGRIDLVQAEAVLGVVDARGEAELRGALAQLGGGLSRPLAELREELLNLLAELEAGLDFAEEDVEFISAEELARRLSGAASRLDEIGERMEFRSHEPGVARAVLAGRPNAGKSTLFNLLVQRFGESGVAPAIVSPQPGTTRDYVTATIAVDGIVCELIDTAGVDATADGGIDAAAQEFGTLVRTRADVEMWCEDASETAGDLEDDRLIVLTKVDLIPDSRRPAMHFSCPEAVLCSGATGEGIGELAATLAQRLRGLAADTSQAGFAASTAARCGESLRDAKRAVAAAQTLAGQGAEELVAAQLRVALEAIGKMVGAVCSDDVLDRVFSRFCIGK